jgi:hypothetical protein
MLIRYGCELSLVVRRPTPVFILLDIHPERRGDITHERCLQASSGVVLHRGHDTFGNLLQRCTVPSGETSFRLSGIVTDSGLPDGRCEDAAALPVVDLPDRARRDLDGSL